MKSTGAAEFVPSWARSAPSGGGAPPAGGSGPLLPPTTTTSKPTPPGYVPSTQRQPLPPPPSGPTKFHVTCTANNTFDRRPMERYSPSAGLGYPAAQGPAGYYPGQFHLLSPGAGPYTPAHPAYGGHASLPSSSAVAPNTPSMGGTLVGGDGAGSRYLLNTPTMGGTRLPTRLQSPAIIPITHNSGYTTGMNPNANEFSPSASALSALPSSTAAAAAADASTTNAPKKASYADAVVSGSSRPAVEPPRRGGSGGVDPKTSVASLVGAVAYTPRRTMMRIRLNRPLATGAASDSGAFEEGKGGETAYPLHEMWKLHYLPRGDRWAAQHDAYDPMMVAQMEDLPTFFRVFNNLPTPSKKKTGTYYLFRDDIDPKWEDDANAGGGMLRVSMGESRVDEAWELLLMRAVGNSWSTSELRHVVNGVVMKMRDPHYVIELWVTRDGEDIRRDLEELWVDEGWVNFTYTPFAAAASASGGKKTNRKGKPPSGSSHTGGGEKKNRTNPFAR
eukprot:gene11643-8027_t